MNLDCFKTIHWHYLWSEDVEEDEKGYHNNRKAVKDPKINYSEIES